MATPAIEATDDDDDATTPTTTTTYLTLGDGDFTYSLDLARYLWHDNHQKIQVIATGIDTREELVAKYKDANHILEKLQQLQVHVHHGVNAILPFDEDGSTLEAKMNEATTMIIPPAGVDVVIFNHPHSGVEDAQLHARLLSHIFHSVANVWLKQQQEEISHTTAAVFHLTLVQGQFERWDCAAACQRHGMVLVGAQPFMPPPPRVNNDNRCTSTSNHHMYYHYRRHQTGKSFGARRPDGQSITYTFMRAAGGSGGSAAAAATLHCLPWQKTATRRNISLIGEESNSSSKEQQTFPCPFCEKEFREERSRKCHVRDRHANNETGAAAAGEDTNTKRPKLLSEEKHWHCEQCLDADGNARRFQSQEALDSHCMAKHSGIHTQIKPAWSQEMKQQRAIDTQHGTEQYSSETCPVCGVLLQGRTLEEHFGDFVPADANHATSFNCTFCEKAFRDRRAVQQHENFCAKRASKGI